MTRGRVLFGIVLVAAMAFVGIDAARSFTHGDVLRAWIESVGVLFGGALLGVARPRP